ncbi:NADH dehydrogenase 1 beta subcomplex subunit 7 ndufb7 [Blomia tropicalis]|nr:NADH dehydrogenase 1 beta subcomplex subunit 7 ndufb7 [Blomia tropicalis]
MGNLPFGLTRDHMSIEKYTFPFLRDVNYPSDRTESPFDPHEGFTHGRKERVMIATEAEMDSAKMKSPEHIITEIGKKTMFKTVLKGDYCAHKYIDMKACLKNNRPFYWRCKHERHAYHECLFDDSVLRMKEWEREKRLRERQKRQQSMEIGA